MRFLEQLAKISFGKKIAILSVLLVLAAVGYWFVSYSANSDELDRVRNEYTQIQGAKQAALQAKASYDRDRRRLDELKATFSQQLKELPTDTQMSAFLDNLNSQAELVGLTLQAVQPTNEEATENYVRIPVKLKLQGTFHQLAKFFYLVGNLDRIINIENINLGVDKATEAGIMLSVDVLATTFRSLSAETSKGAGAAKPAGN
jgi:type IV pilus assembly protein PilO